MASDSWRHKLMDAIKARMQTILTTGGYETNAGSNVHHWKTDSWDSNELPGINIKDIEETVVARETSRQLMTLSVDICGICSSSTTTGDTLGKLLADIVKAIGTDDTWTVSTVPYAIRTIYKGNSMGLLQEQNTVAGVEVHVDIEYRMGRFDPYTAIGQ